MPALIGPGYSGTMFDAAGGSRLGEHVITIGLCGFGGVTRRPCQHCLLLGSMPGAALRPGAHLAAS
jgi:hypothetical protein